MHVNRLLCPPKGVLHPAQLVINMENHVSYPGSTPLNTTNISPISLAEQQRVELLLGAARDGHGALDALEQDVADADADLVVLVDAGGEHALAHGQEHGDRVKVLRVALASVEDDRVAAHHEGGPVLQQPPEELLLGRAHHVVRVDQGGLSLEREHAGRGEGELQPPGKEV